MLKIKKLFSVWGVLLAFLFSGQMLYGEKSAFFCHSKGSLHVISVFQQEISFRKKLGTEGRKVKGFSRKLAKRQVKELALTATQNPDSKKVMLGRYVENSESSYNIKAGKEYTFFELRNWDEIYRQTGFEYAEMWRICERFMKNQLRDGKEFYFSHDPNNPQGRGFSMEVAYLKKKKKRIRFVRIEDIWKAVW